MKCHLAAMEGAKEGQFFKIDSTGVTLREYLWGGNIFAAFFGWVISKIFRVRLPSSVDDLNVATPAPFQIPRKSLPNEIRERFAPIEQELARVGFQLPAYYAFEDVYHSTKIYQACFIHESGQTFARVHYRHWAVPMPPKEYFFTTLISAFTDDSMLVSTSGQPDMLTPPGCRINRQADSPITDLWNSHMIELHKESKASHIDQGPEGLARAIERHHIQQRDFHQKRGVFKPMSESDCKVAELRRKASNPQTAAAPPSLPSPETTDPTSPPPLGNAVETKAFTPNPENAPILAELEVLQNKPASNWLNGLILLAVSAGLFVSAGAWRWDVEIVLLLVPILLFHEFGHFVAMKTFDYRNLKMFFIPLFGAAVSGTHYNVPGWKKVVVSLAGPVPGIIVGIIMGVAGIVWDMDLLLKAASLTLILNGLNLLPILPLDGGWVVHAVLFSRNYLLESAFRGIAAVGLLAGSALIGDRILMFLGIVMIIGLFPSIKMAKISHDLKKRGVTSSAQNDQSIPPETADAIITEVREKFPSNLTIKQGAEFTLQIFESLNARAPGAGLSLVFLTTQLIAFAAAFVFGSMCIFGQSGRLGDFMRMAAEAPEHTYQHGTMVTWTGADADYTDSLKTKTIIANFAKADKAASSFQSLTNDLSPRTAACLFGQTILVATRTDDSEDRSAIFRKLEEQAAEVFVPGTNTYWGFTVSTLVPSEEIASELDTQCSPFFAIVPLNSWLIPPWHPEDPRSAETKSAHQVARYTYHRIVNRYDYEEPDDEELDAANEEIHKELVQARRLGDDAKVKELQDKLNVQAEAERTAFYEELRSGTNEVDPDVISKYIAYEEKMRGTNGPQFALLREIAKDMGTVAMDGDHPLPGAASYSILSGSVDREGLLLQFRWLRFQNPFVGTQAFANWLADKNINEFQYSFYGPEILGDE